MRFGRDIVKGVQTEVDGFGDEILCELPAHISVGVTLDGYGLSWCELLI